MSSSALLAPEIDATPEKELPETPTPDSETVQSEPSEIRWPQRRDFWYALAIVLLTWNMTLSWLGGPKTFIQGYDGVQYQLLARNRVAGATAMGDQGHTVRNEASHPMWRPGLVWIIEGLARLTGSVRIAGCMASALAVTVLELVLLGLGYCCFGRGALALLLILLVCPTSFSVWMLRLAIGQGPEPWAATATLSGLAVLIAAWHRQSWKLALLAGAVAGFSEWFRTGNLVVFAVPCLFYALVAIGWKRWRVVGQPLAALGVFLVVSMVAGKLCSSPVNKTSVNLWGNMLETDGLQFYVWGSEDKPAIIYMGGLKLVGDTNEVVYDHIVRKSSEGEGPKLRQEAGLLARLYFERLGEAVAGGFTGLRVFIGGFLLLCFGFTVLVLPMRRETVDLHTMALAVAALAFYFGPIILLRGDDPTHYTLVVLPLFALVAVRGVLIAYDMAKERLPDLSAYRVGLRRAGMFFVVPPVVCLTLAYYVGAYAAVRKIHDETEIRQASLDALDLEGKRVACRDMSWFVDRDVQTILFPYASVEQLDAYALAHDIDGILLWTEEGSVFFSVTPYGLNPESFRESMAKSTVFGPPHHEGEWVWYPVVDSASGVALARRVRTTK